MHVAAALGVVRYARRRVLTYARRLAGQPRATRANQAS
jgi:hypothetical protein